MSSATKFISKSRKRRYDVYLSFCDQDSHSFALGLNRALTSHGFVVYWEDQLFESENRRSKQPSDSTLNVIGDCEVVVIVLSKNYTNSRWCLQEFEKITQCCRRTTDGPVVLPFFYDAVHPNNNLNNAFLDRISASSKDEDEDKLMTWVAAITNQASKYHVSRHFRRYHSNERDLIMNVVEFATHVRNKRTGSSSNYYTWNIHSRAQDVIQLLKQSKSPLLLGIWGMPGNGKTTIARAIFDQIGPYFEHTFFLNLKNIEEVWKERNGQVSLQEKLVFYSHFLTGINIRTVESGRVIIKEALQHKRVLLILEDVDKLEQLQALCGNRDWFGPGSKIIITTRNRHLLKESELCGPGNPWVVIEWKGNTCVEGCVEES